MQGIRSVSDLPGVLAAPYAARRSGFLHFVQADERRSLRFRNGHVAYAATNVSEEHLGETLVHHGWLRPEDLRSASEMVGRDGRRLGSVLVASGFIDAGRLDEALMLHARTVIGGLFAWNAGGYEFEEQDEGSSAGGDLGDPFTVELIAGAARRLVDEETIRAALGDLDRRLGLGDLPSDDRPLTLASADHFVLGHVDGTRTAREIVALRPGAARETLGSVLTLLCIGLLQWSASAPAARSAVREEVEGAVSEDASGRDLEGPPIDDSAAVDVRDALERAEMFVAIERNWEAIQILEKVLPHLEPPRIKRTARVLLARAYLRNPKWVHRAEEALQTVVREDPTNVDALLLLGKLYGSQGFRHRAESMLRRVLELQPGHGPATAELKALAGKPLLKKLFGR